MNKVFVISGSGGSGKSTFIEQCGEFSPDYIINELSTVYLVKYYAFRMGWDGTKDDKGRRLLSDIKDALNRYDPNIIQDDIGYNMLKIERNVKRIHSSHSVFHFINAREPEDIEYFVKKYNAKTILVINPNVEPITTNRADSRVNEYTKYDYKIVNSGTLEDLHDFAQMFMEIETNE